MAKKSFTNVNCPKCGRKYAIPKGSTKEFHCPGKNCHAMVNQQTSSFRSSVTESDDTSETEDTSAAAE